MKINEITALIDKVNETGLAELKIEKGDFKLCLKSKDYLKALKGNKQVVVSAPVAQAALPMAQTPAAAPAAVSANNAPAPASTEAETATADNAAIIKAPMIGTFYRSQGPEKPPFVNVGDNIKKGDTICIIEAMKLFNEIEAEVSGKVVKVLVDDASPVEYDQPIIEIIPD